MTSTISKADQLRAQAEQLLKQAAMADFDMESAVDAVASDIINRLRKQAIEMDATLDRYVKERQTADTLMRSAIIEPLVEEYPDFCKLDISTSEKNISSRDELADLVKAFIANNIPKDVATTYDTVWGMLANELTYSFICTSKRQSGNVEYSPSVLLFMKSVTAKVLAAAKQITEDIDTVEFTTRDIDVNSILSYEGEGAVRVGLLGKKEFEVYYLRMGADYSSLVTIDYDGVSETGKHKWSVPRVDQRSRTTDTTLKVLRGVINREQGDTQRKLNQVVAADAAKDWAANLVEEGLVSKAFVDMHRQVVGKIGNTELRFKGAWATETPESNLAVNISMQVHSREELEAVLQAIENMRGAY